MRFEHVRIAALAHDLPEARTGDLNYMNQKYVQVDESRAAEDMARVLDGQGSFGGHGHIAGTRIPLDDCAKSSVACVERKLRGNALAILGTSQAGELPPEGDPLV